MGVLLRRIATWFVGAEAAAAPRAEELDLLTVASHEFRTPLTSIKAAIHLLNLDNEDFSPRAKRLLRIADVETDRLIRLTTDILDSARNEAGELPINCDWTSLAEVITQACEGLMPLAEQSNVILHFDRSLPFEIFADPVRLEQVLTNIVANAIRHSPERGTIFITAQPDAFAHMVIEIKDEGPGIEASQHHTLFKTFRQTNSAGTSEKTGSGLGLSITKTLVERMGGTLGVRSESGRGSVFYVSLRDWRKDLSHKNGLRSVA